MDLKTPVASKYAVGEEVQLANPASGWHQDLLGTVGTISEVHDQYYVLSPFCGRGEIECEEGELRSVSKDGCYPYCERR